VTDRARELGLELDQPESVNSEEARARIAAAEPEAVLICAFGALIAEPLLSAHPMLNVHPSLLPRWRGAAPVERAIEAGDVETGVSIMRPTAELDAGPVCLQGTEQIREDDDYGSLAPRLAALGGELLGQALDTSPAFRDQGEDGVTYAEKIGPDDRLLDPFLTAAELDRRVRALTPHVGTYAAVGDGERLVVTRARPLPGNGPDAGTLENRGGSLLLGCSDGALELLDVRPAGGRTMAAADYLRGQGRGIPQAPAAEDGHAAQ
jgi:methionyl-tRNA formyltransferase